MPKLLSSAPTFLVSSVDVTARWYEEILGFSANFFPVQPPHVYASLQRDSVEIMLLRQEGYKKTQVQRDGSAWDAYIRVNDVRALCEEVRARTSLKTELTQRSYGDTEFEVEDPNGYLLVFGG